MKRITKKRINTWLANNAKVVKTTGPGLEDAPDSYVSLIDDSYITFVGMEDNVKPYIKRGINQLQGNTRLSGKTASIGFNEEENKWYGWSHRAIFGFTIGSETKKGNCGYQPDTKENFMEDCLNFWVDKEYSSGNEKAIFTKGIGYFDDELLVDGVLVSYTYNDKVPNEKLRGTVYTYFSQFPDEWGKGEWTATTMEEAKEMAMDFASGVS